MTAAKLLTRSLAVGLILTAGSALAYLAWEVHPAAGAAVLLAGAYAALWIAERDD